MRVRNRIPDPADDQEALDIQVREARKVRLGDAFKLVAGVDVAYSKDDERAYVAACVLSTGNWKVVHEQRLVLPVRRRYESGMLCFREGPLAVEALRKLSVEPDVILVDGHGIAHPRMFGLASYVGVTLDHPTIGVGKNWPPGCAATNANYAGQRRGTKTLLRLEVGHHQVGYEVVTQPNVNPIYVSPGHRVNCEQAASIALRAAPFYRLPEPLRAADHAANEFRREKEGS